MNSILKALNNEIKRQENQEREIKNDLRELYEKRQNEMWEEQKRLIKLFNKHKYKKLEMINKDLPDGYCVSGFDTDTYLNSTLVISITRNMYIFDFHIEEGDIVYRIRRSNDGVGTNNSKKIIEIIDRVLNIEEENL